MYGMMPMKAIILESPQDSEWTSFVSSQNGLNIFHHSGWAELLSETYRYPVFVAAVRDEAGKLSGGLPLADVHSPLTGRRWVSLPFSDHYQPVIADPDCWPLLVKMLQYHAEIEKIPKVEMRWLLEAPSRTIISEDMLYLLDLSVGADALEAGMNRYDRKSIRKATKNQVVVELDNSLDAVRQFYTLHVRNRAELGVPVQPYRFFANLYHRLIAQGFGFIALAYHDNRCVAGAVFLHWKKTLTSKYSASLRQFLPLRANDLIFWTAIQWGCEHGYQVWDFGKVAIENEGLRTFKRKWGAQETPLNYTLLPEQPHDTGGSGRLMKLGGVVLRNSPAILTRVAGELFYRHFG